MSPAQIFLVVVLALGASAKIFDKCSLSRELRRLGAPEAEIPDWICLVEHESRFDTRAVGSLNADGSKDWGLFQLNDNYWCQSDSRPSANVCRVPCHRLLSDDISEAFQCAMAVKKVHGFHGWVAWVTHCQNRIYYERYC